MGMPETLELIESLLLWENTFREEQGGTVRKAISR
jgi:hypothetical protein